MITSSQNKVIKEVKTLSKKRDRSKKGLFVAEGLRFVQSALEVGADIDFILYSESIFRTDEGLSFVKHLEAEGQYKILEVEEKIMSELSDTQSPQGILAVVKQPKWEWKNVIKENGFVLILDRLQDPGNLGTIIRTADAAGVDGIVTLKGSVDVFNPKVLRSTMGSIFELPILEGLEWDLVESELKEQGYTVLGTALEDDSVEYNTLNYNKSTAMIIGNEANGIESDILSAVDHKIIIPIVGSAESLNAGVAAAVVMYEVLRQRRRN